MEILKIDESIFLNEYYRHKFMQNPDGSYKQEYSDVNPVRINFIDEDSFESLYDYEKYGDDECLFIHELISFFSVEAEKKIPLLVPLNMYFNKEAKYENTRFSSELIGLIILLLKYIDSIKYCDDFNNAFIEDNSINELKDLKSYVEENFFYNNAFEKVDLWKRSALFEDDRWIQLQHLSQRFLNKAGKSTKLRNRPYDLRRLVEEFVIEYSNHDLF